MTLNIKSLSAVAPRAIPLQPIGHFRYIKIKHDSESWRTQTKKMNKHMKTCLFIFFICVLLDSLSCLILLTIGNHALRARPTD